MKHGKYKTCEYEAWRSMKQRCYYSKSVNFKNYGGRGIAVCERWRDSFENFLADVGERPSPQHSLERKDVNGNYEPRNVCWATIAEQSRNTKRTIRLTAFGTTQCLYDWARKYGLSFPGLKRRLERGMSVEEALTAKRPEILNESSVREIRDLWGSGVPQKDLASMYGVSKQTINGVVKGRRWGWVV